MENEELAALRATLLAAQRQPTAVREREARLSALLAEGHELLPYVLAASCSDPRDRVARDDPRELRVLEGGDARPLGAREPSPAPPRRLAALIAGLVLLWLVAQLLGLLVLRFS